MCFATFTCFNSFASLRKVLWVPGSKTELAIVSETFIKIYDLSVDILSPQYCFTVMSGKVKDATFAINTKVCLSTLTHVIIMGDWS